MPDFLTRSRQKRGRADSYAGGQRGRSRHAGPVTNLEVVDKIVTSLPLLADNRARGTTSMEHPPFRELCEFLSALPRAQMLAVITIMYFGRDDGNSIYAMQEHCDRTFGDSGIMAWQLLGKEPALERYFSAARQRARMDGIDLNQLPLKPAVAGKK